MPKKGQKLVFMKKHKATYNQRLYIYDRYLGLFRDGTGTGQNQFKEFQTARNKRGRGGVVEGKGETVYVCPFVCMLSAVKQNRLRQMSSSLIQILKNCPYNNRPWVIQYKYN